MKKLSLMLLIICVMTSITNAQKAYIRLGVGGGVGLKQYEGDLWADETNTANANNLVIKSMGLGSGFNANLAFGYMLSKYVGLELGVNEFIGLNKKRHYSFTADEGGGDYTSDTKISGMMLQIVPALVITPGLEKLNPYARLGMIIGILPSMTAKSTSESTYNIVTLKATHTGETSSKSSGGIALGFTAAGGVEYDLSEKLSFFGEMVFNGITYAPKKGKLKTYTVDGKDMLPDLTTRDKEWTYEKEYDTDETIPTGSPDKTPKSSLNFSNVELNIGIKLKL